MTSKINSRITQIILFVVFTQISGFSQTKLYPGYFVNNNMDTVFGKGIIGKNHNFFWFQQADMQELHKFLPSEVYCVRFSSGKYYIPKEITYNQVVYQLFKKNIVIEKTDKFFFEYLLDGEVDLFMLRENGHKKYYIEKSGMPIHELNFFEYTMKVDGKYYKISNPVFREFLKVYMQDSPEICIKIDNMQALNPNSLIKLSEEYHHNVCSNYDCINYTKKVFGHKTIKNH